MNCKEYSSRVDKAVTELIEISGGVLNPINPDLISPVCDRYKVSDSMVKKIMFNQIAMHIKKPLVLFDYGKFN